MAYGICHLGIVPLRLEPSHTSSMVNQVLYGDAFKVTEKRKFWSKIRLYNDKCEGFIDNKQFKVINKETYKTYCRLDSSLSKDLCDFITDEIGNLQTIVTGSNINAVKLFKHQFEGAVINFPIKEKNIVSTAYSFLNTAELQGGRTPFGIDSSGFTQLVYNLNGIHLSRSAPEQALEGEVLSFIEEAAPGDLAFFDNNDGDIIHVGIILENHHIIHAFGKVRIDRIDQSGIYNQELNEHTHKLRVIKKIL